MPIAFKEWAVTVRALAEGEQLLTLRKGGIREPEQHFRLEHERFFLYPTFDHQRNDLVRDSHQPELRAPSRRASGPRASRRPRPLTQDGGIAQPDRVRIRAWAEVAGHWTIADPRTRRRAVAVLRVDQRLRREAAGVEAAASAARGAAAHLPHPAPRDRQGQGRVRRLPVLAGDPARPAVRGHARCSPTTSSTVPARRSRASCRRRRPRAGLSPDPAAIFGPATRAARCIGIGGGGDVVGALACADARPRARPRDGDRRPDLGAPPGRPAARPAPPRRAANVDGGSTTPCAIAGPDTTGPGGFRFAESRDGRA